ncbi:hypothetical protein J3Q64DRAFT_1746731 [Phycomyces blakesleeanus]|uniref:Endosomal/vacuolar adapter protein YPT35 n=1 Tax=Phycomyces blakesleeanus TaxID=4837 RepID=A0ABR3AX15_PHYBL
MNVLDQQKDIGALLEVCQTQWETLQSHGKYAVDESIRQCSRDLHEGIKLLVNLQDELDEVGQEEVDSAWLGRYSFTMEEVQKRLQSAMDMATTASSTPGLTKHLKQPHGQPTKDTVIEEQTCYVKAVPMVTQSAPLKLPGQLSSSLRSTSSSSQNTCLLNSSISEEDEDEDEDDDYNDEDSYTQDTPKNSQEALVPAPRFTISSPEKQFVGYPFLNRVSEPVLEDMDQEINNYGSSPLESKQFDNDYQQYSSAISLPKIPKSNSSVSMYSLPPRFIDSPARQENYNIQPPVFPTASESTERSFGRRSLTIEEFPELKVDTERRSKLLIPLLKSKNSSRSTPLPGAPARINFYKNDENSDSKDNEIFASDAIVNHPLRIGIGYGSYICYSCTVLSNKGASIIVRKRYSDFVDLREELIKKYPKMKKNIPKLPPKKVVGNFTPVFVEHRRRDLEYFFKYVVLHPSLGNSSIVKHWIAP